MADYYEHERGRGRRTKRGGKRKDFYGDRDDHYKDDQFANSQNSSQPFKSPIILAKPNRDNHLQNQITGGSQKSQDGFDSGKSQDSHITGGKYFSESDTGSQPIMEKQPIIMSRPKESTPNMPVPVLLTRPKHTSNEDTSSPSGENANNSSSSPAIPVSYQIQQRKSSSTSSTSPPRSAAASNSLNSLHNKPSPTTPSKNTSAATSSLMKISTKMLVPRMNYCVKLIDDGMVWCDAAMEMLIDQSDFLAIGVLGMQGVGKSALLSMLASSGLISQQKEIFKSQSLEVRECGSHQTSGVDLFVTPERNILLDTQPILSSSVLDYMIHNDKKYPPEYTTAENCIEMQSLQLASFLMTVCNVVVIVMDWFVDLNLLKFLQTAETLKPATPTSSHDNSSELYEYYPYLVFVLNKAEREDFSVENYRAMQDIIMKVFEKSKLKFRGPLTIANGKLVPGLNRNTIQHNCNLCLIPNQDDKGDKNADFLTTLNDYDGHPGYENITRALRNKLFSAPRNLLTHTVLSERNWFHYAARSWEAIKKSQLFVEYNRLLP